MSLWHWLNGCIWQSIKAKDAEVINQLFDRTTQAEKNPRCITKLEGAIAWESFILCTFNNLKSKSLNSSLLNLNLRSRKKEVNHYKSIQIKFMRWWGKKGRFTTKQQKTNHKKIYWEKSQQSSFKFKSKEADIVRTTIWFERNISTRKPPFW